MTPEDVNSLSMNCWNELTIDYSFREETNGQSSLFSTRILLATDQEADFTVGLKENQGRPLDCLHHHRNRQVHEVVEEFLEFCTALPSSLLLGVCQVNLYERTGK